MITRNFGETDEQLRTRMKWTQKEMLPMAQLLLRLNMLPHDVSINIITNELSKALSASIEESLIYGQGALEVESLEQTLKSVTFNGLSKQIGMQHAGKIKK